MAVLYAAQGQSLTTSDLYTIDPVTLAATSVGALGYALSGLAMDPTSGILYGATSNNSAAHPASLISIDTTTGAGTFIGAFVAEAMSDICFDSSGQLYGWTTGSLGLYHINKSTGAATWLGGYNDGFAGGLDFDSGGTLYHAHRFFSGAGIVILNPTDGSFVSQTANFSGYSWDSLNNIQGGSIRAADGLMWCVTARSNLTTSTFFTLDLTSAVSTLVGTCSVAKFDAIAWSVDTAAGNFSLAASPTSLSVIPGASGTSTITATLLSGPDDTASMGYTAPAGVTVSFDSSTIDENGGSVVATITISNSVAIDQSLGISINATDSDETQSVGITVLTVPHSCPTTDFPGTAHTGFVVGADYITDDQISDFSGGNYFEYTDFQPSFFIQGDCLPDPGRYVLRLRCQMGYNAASDQKGFAESGSTASDYNSWVIFYRNDHFMGTSVRFFISAYQHIFDGEEFFIYLTGPPFDEMGTTSGAGATHHYDGLAQGNGGAESVSIDTGDVLTFVLANLDNSSPNRHLRVYSVEFILVDGSPLPATAAQLSIPRTPLGLASWSDPLTTADIRQDQTISANSNNIDPKCLVVTDDDHLWVATNEWGSPHTVNLWEWDGAAWTLRSGDVTGRGNPITGGHNGANGVDGLEMVTDGTNLYIAYGGRDGTTTGGVKNYKVYVRKYTPGSGFTDLGSGLANLPGSSRTSRWCDAGSFSSGVTLAISPGGTLWVGWAESNDVNVVGPTHRNDAYLYYWTGSAWVDSSLPKPPYVRGTNGYDVAIGYGSIQHPIELVFCHHDGPSENPAAIYGVFHSGTSKDGTNRQAEYIYHEYDGASWGNRLRFNLADCVASDGSTDATGFTRIAWISNFTQQRHGFLDEGKALLTDGTSVFFAVSTLGELTYAERPVYLKLGTTGFTDDTKPAPSSPVLDNFNRSENPLSTNWSREQLSGGIVSADGSKAVVDSATSTDSIYIRTDLGVVTDAEIVFTVPSSLSTSTIQGVFVRGNPLTTFGSFTGYKLVVLRGDFGAGTVDRVWLYRNSIGDARTDILVRDDLSISAGDSFAVQVRGALFMVWYKPSAGSWQFLGDASDGTFASGYTGIVLNDPAAGIDSFGAQTLSDSPMVFSPPDEFWQQPDSVLREDFRNSRANPALDTPAAIWEEPSGCQAVMDSQGTVWWGMDASTLENYATYIMVRGEVGNAYGWAMAGANNAIPSLVFIEGNSRLAVNSSATTLYVLAYYNNSPKSLLGVWECPISRIRLGKDFVVHADHRS